MPRRPRQGLRKLLARAVVFGVAATQHGCCCPETDNPTVDVQLERAMPDIATLIDRCVANPDDCEPLCQAALEVGLGPDAQYYSIADCEPTPTATGALVHIEYYENVACGRAPAGLGRCAHAAAPDAVTAWLARAAHLEAASVAAFIHLAADLAHHRAPRALIAAAVVAAHDEIRHANAVRALIGDRVAVPLPRVAPYRHASLRDLALANAAEGCARETVGAAINLWQARCARDPAIRAAFARIAGDELAHAELAWRVHGWAMRQLSAADAADVAAAHRAALARFTGDDLVPIDDTARISLGLPTRAEQIGLVATLLPALVASTVAEARRT